MEASAHPCPLEAPFCAAPGELARAQGPTDPRAYLPALGFLWFCSRCLLGGVSQPGARCPCVQGTGEQQPSSCAPTVTPLMWTAPHQNEQPPALPACWFNPKMLHKCLPGVLIRGLCMLPVGLAPCITALLFPPLHLGGSGGAHQPL